MISSEKIALAAGALVVMIVALAAATVLDRPLADRISARAQQVIAGVGGENVTARFTGRFGWPTRHPVLSGAEDLNQSQRAQIARAVGAASGVASVTWADSMNIVRNTAHVPSPLHCQEEVEALLAARTIRFEESSATISSGSNELIDEVAAALRPCLGSIIAVTGHTDTSGPEPGNLQLSRTRADAIVRALRERGIPADGLRASGVGSQVPVEGLDPADPANRRIEFSVIQTQPIRPTPVDTPEPR